MRFPNPARFHRKLAGDPKSLVFRFRNSKQQTTSASRSSRFRGLDSGTNSRDPPQTPILTQVKGRLIFQKGAAPISECGPVEIPLQAVLCHDIRSRADSVCNDYVINHTQIARVYVINTHASAGFDRGLNDFTRFVHNVTRPVENITAPDYSSGLREQRAS